MSKLISATSKFPSRSGRRDTRLRIAAPQDVHSTCMYTAQHTCKCSANSRRQRVLSRGLRSKFSFISANRPERILGSWHVTKGAARLVRITVLDHEISLTFTVLLARNPDCEIDYRRIRMLGANYTTLLIYGPICGGANRVQFGSTFNV